MNGLQTIQKTNDAAIAFARAKRNTPVLDVVDNYFVFAPNGYEIIYHDNNRLPDDGRPVLSIEFKGDDGNGPRFDVTPQEGPVACNRTLAETAEYAASKGLNAAEVAGRLGELFAEVSRN